jgi:putative FmdB family regulatory protein
MPTYEYECQACGCKFERRQAISDAPLAECPECRGEVHRLVSGGAGFILKGGDHNRVGQGGSRCSLEQEGTTCCGRQERCDRPPCGG